MASLFNRPQPFTLQEDRTDSKYFTVTEFNDAFPSDSDSFSLLHINARSLNKNFEYLQNLLSSLDNFQFSAIGVSETWLHSTSPPLFNLPNYHMQRVDRQGRRGGGVALYVNKKFNFKIRNDMRFEEAEVLFIELENPSNKNIIIGLLYRPPNTLFDLFYENLENCLNILSEENKQIFFMGDFNINFLANNNNKDRFFHLMYSHAFYSHIKKPTRINLNSSTLIDNIFSNVHDKEIDGGLLCSEMSDHIPIFIVCKCKISSSVSSGEFTRRKETVRNIELLKQDLALEDWLDVFNEPNVNSAYEKFNLKLQHYYNKNIPKVKVKRNPQTAKNPWITKGILTSIKKRNRLYKIFIQKPTNQNHNNYKKYRNKLTNIIRTSRKLYYSQQLHKVNSNSRATWQVINEILGKKTDNLPKDKFTLHGDNIVNPHNYATVFNSFFSNIGPKLASQIKNKNNTHFTDFLPEPFNKSIFFNPTNPNEIINITKALNSSKSQGYDEMSTSLLKQIIHFIAAPLTHIFNLSLQLGKFPNLLKIAKVTPIYKKDDPHEISNYRPISILPSISKILEKVVYNRLYHFLNSNKLLNPNQYGFRKNHSTDLALIQIYDKITKAMANKEHVLGLFFDLSKAFDTLNHGILLQKLHSYGIRGNALSWVKDYLSNRQQYVTFNGTNSGFLPITCGVPQGSILGPLLFLLYINDISKTSSLLDFVLFADDTNIFYSHPNLNTLVNTLNTELPKISSWFKCNKLSLNINKTHFMHFKQTTANTAEIPINIIIDNLTIEHKQNSKFLGVYIDENLTWNNHLHHVTSCVSKGVGIISKLKLFLPQSTLLLLYNTMVLPYITYCNTVWANCAKTKILPILLLQKRALRICSGAPYLANSDPLFRKLKTMKIADINTFQVAVFMFKYFNNQLPSTFDNMFTLNESIHSYPTRSSHNFHLTNPKILLAHKSIRHHGPDLWNSLPNDIKSCTTLYSFKSKMKTKLLSQYMYIT